MDASTCIASNVRDQFYVKLSETLSAKRGDNNVFLTVEKYERVLSEVKKAKTKDRKEPKDYRRLKRYDILLSEGKERLIRPRTAENKAVQYFVGTDELFDILYEAHLSIGHGGRNRMIKELRSTYCNITTESIMLFLTLCEECKHKQIMVKRHVQVKPLLPTSISRCGIDIIDMQSHPCNANRFILICRYAETRFVVLRAMGGNSYEDVATCLLDVFSLLGAPNVLHASYGRDFCNQIIEWIGHYCSEMKMIHADHPVNHDSVAQNVGELLTEWMHVNRTADWVIGLSVVQMKMNRLKQKDVDKSPYEAVCGCSMKLGLTSTLLPDEITSLRREEELKKVLEESCASTEINIKTEVDDIDA